MPNTFTKIASYTATSGVSSFTFSSIPQTYTDLCLKISDQGSRAAFYTNTAIKVNNTTGVYDWKWVRNYAGTTGSFLATNDTDLAWYGTGSGSNSSYFGNTEIYFPNYANSSYYKGALLENIVEQPSADCFWVVGAYLYKSTNPITSLVIYGSANNYTIQTGTTATLYGIKNS
jgi:hypothetical protein